MGTVDQPKPSSPGQIQPEQRPLEPGQTTASSPRQQSPQRVDPHTADEMDNRTESERTGRHDSK